MIYLWIFKCLKCKVLHHADQDHQTLMARITLILVFLLYPYVDLL